MKKIPFFSALLLVTSLHSIRYVEANDYTAESDFFGESPVVLTVSRMHKPLSESPASVSVIDRQMIRNSGARDIAELFRMVPGFIVGYISGHQPVVTYHGLGHQWHRQMQVLIDGRSVFIPSFGGIPWSNLPLLMEDIERIEITRGPNAVTYGSNAFLATINIITRHAAEDLGGEISYTHDLESDWTAQDLYLRVGNHYRDFDWRLSAGREKDQGFELENDTKILEKLNLRADFLTAYNQFWTVQAGINQSQLGRGDGTETDAYRDEESSNSYQNIKWELIQEQVSTTVKLTHTRQNVNDRFTTEPINSYLDTQIDISPYSFTLLPDFTVDINFDRLSDRTDIELFQNRKLGQKATLVYGASMRRDQVESIYLFSDDLRHKVDTNNLFGSVEMRTEHNLLMDIGLMFEDSNYTDPETSGRFSLLQKLDQHTLRFVTSSARRNPILHELIGETRFVIDLPPGLPAPLDQPYPLVLWRADGLLVPETILSTEIGLFSEFIKRQLTTDLKLFQYHINDQITDQIISVALDPETGFPQQYDLAVNEGEIEVDGLELAVNYSPNDKKLRVYGAISLTDARSTDQDYADSFPEKTAFIGGLYNFDEKQQASATLYLVDAFSWTDRTVRIDNYEKLDLRYQYTIDRTRDIRLELIGQNLLGEFTDYRRNTNQQQRLLLTISGRF